MSRIAVWRCRACGFEYDDEAEGINFENTPDDWVCPVCGAEKDMFDKI